jgi:hypothetical protein
VTRDAKDFTAHEQEHDRDPADNLDSYVLLDDGELYVSADAMRCLACGYADCDCAPISRKEFRQMAARYDAGKRWQS